LLSLKLMLRKSLERPRKLDTFSRLDGAKHAMMGNPNANKHSDIIVGILLERKS